jgi:DNA-binding NarL/FixJ family response regulator
MSDGSDVPAVVRVVIADDSALIRRGLEAMLSGRQDLEFAGAGSDGEELDELVATAQPDVVVTDLRMPPSGGREGIRIATRLRRSHPQIGVVVLSQYVEPEFAIELMSDGSSRRAYLLKDRVADAPELVRAIHAVNEGGSVVDPAVVEALIDAQQRKQSSPLAALTEREREVLSLIAEGASNASIAESLVLTKRAVEKHVNSIFAKLRLTEAEDVSRRVKAALLFLADEEIPARSAG